MSLSIKLSSPDTQEFWEIPVLFEDEHLLALDKPGGMLTAPVRTAPNRPSLLGLLHQGIAEQKPWAKSRSLAYLMITHRVEDDASGVVLLAKNKPVFIKVANYFGSNQPCKHWLAIVHGNPPTEEFEVEIKIAADHARPGLMRVNSKLGKQSRTLFKVTERFSRYTLLEANLFTDRTHQVRLSLRSKGLPVAGDSLYGGKPLLLSRLKQGYRLKSERTERPLIPRAALHVDRIQFPHPVTNTAQTIAAPLPKDFLVGLKYLRRYSAANVVTSSPIA